MMLEIRDLSFAWPRKESVFEQVSFDVEAGSVFAILGANGAGKSTLLRCINHNLRPDAGRVVSDGRSVATMSQPERAEVFAVLPQETAAAFGFQSLDVVLMGCRGRGEQRLSVALNAMEQAGVSALASRRIDELSGGERRRVYLARALAQASPVLLLDEPTMHLDVRFQFEVMRLARRLARNGHAVIVVSHDMELTARYCDRFLLLHEGRTRAVGGFRDVLTGRNIRAVFGVDAQIQDAANPEDRVIRIRPC